MERVRNRDLRTSNKCYSMFFDDDKPKSRKSKSKSPRKKDQQKNDTSNDQYTHATDDSHSKENQLINDEVLVDKKQFSDNNMCQNKLDPSKLAINTNIEKTYDNPDEKETTKKVQKRKLSEGAHDTEQENENNGENDEDSDVIVENAEENVINFSKKLKTESLKEQMYQVRSIKCTSSSTTTNITHMLLFLRFYFCFSTDLSTMGYQNLRRLSKN